MASSDSFFSKVHPIDTDHMAPLYVQLRDSIREAIESGKLQRREALPAEREISGRMQISRITVRKAIRDLVDEGLLIRQQGSGTFVASRVEKQFSQLSSFSEDMAARGRKVRNEWLGREIGAVSTDEALAFGISPGSKVFRFQRIRYAGDIAMAVEHATIASFAMKEEDVVEKSLYDAMAISGHRPVRALQRMRAVLFEAEQAELLELEVGAPALFIERRSFNAAGLMIEMTRSWYRGTPTISSLRSTEDEFSACSRCITSQQRVV